MRLFPKKFTPSAHFFSKHCAVHEYSYNLCVFINGILFMIILIVIRREWNGMESKEERGCKRKRDDEKNNHNNIGMRVYFLLIFF